MFCLEDNKNTIFDERFDIIFDDPFLKVCKNTALNSQKLGLKTDVGQILSISVNIHDFVASVIFKHGELTLNRENKRLIK